MSSIQFGNAGAHPPETLLRYGPNAFALPRELELQLISYCEAVGIPWQDMLITNTFRTIEEQARVMSQNYTPLSAASVYKTPKGVLMLSQWALYLDAGMDSYSAILQAIQDSGWVSDHMRTDRATVDISPSSVPATLIAPFVAYCKTLKSEVIEVIAPSSGGDHALHVAFIPRGDMVARVEAAAAAAVGLEDQGGEDENIVGMETGIPVKGWLAVGAGLGLVYWFWKTR